MKHRGLKFLSLLLTLALLVGLLPGMTLTAYADVEVWSSNKTIDTDQTISNGVNVIESITLTINEGKKLTVDGRIYVLSGCTLTVAGKGTLEVIGRTGVAGPIGDKGSDGRDGTYSENCGAAGKNGGNGAGGGVGIEADLVVDGATVIVTGGTGGTGGKGGDGGNGYGGGQGEERRPGGSGGTGGTGGAGGVGIKGSVTVNSGSITVTGGAGGDGGDGGAAGQYGQGSFLPENRPTAGAKGQDGSPGQAVSGTLPNNAQESDDGITWSAVTGGTSSKRYVKVESTQPAAGQYTVTYDPGRGSGENQTFNAIDNGQGGYKHAIEKCEDNFTAPEGEHFDHWDDGKGHTYKYGDTINPVTENITLTAIWVADSKPDSGSGGSGSGFDIVFNIPGADNSWEYVGGGYAPQQAYRVSLAPMQGGSAALGLTTGDSGAQMNVYPSTTVYVFPNAEQGYTLDKIVWSLIDGSASYDITEAKNFVMPAMDAVVYVTFRPVG